MSELRVWPAGHVFGIDRLTIEHQGKITIYGTGSHPETGTVSDAERLLKLLGEAVEVAKKQEV
ncbi:MAG: hypothetical protein ACLQMF_16440 [Rectinemataceae bacterium]